MKDLLGLPIDASAHGPALDDLTGLVHWLMALLFVGWSLYFIYVLFRFRRSKNPQANYHGTKGKASKYVEGAVAVIEGVFLIGFAIPLWAERVDAFPPEEESTVIRVVAEQFAWNAHYAGKDGVFGRTDINLVSADNPLGLDRNDPAAKDDIFTVNNLNFPVGKPVIIYLSSKDVIHSFALPLFRVKQDAIPGERIPLWFIPTKTTAKIREELAWEEPVSTIVPSMNNVLMKDYVAADGAVIGSKGDFITDELIAALRRAGIQKVLISQDVPTEIACAQLCGLGHFRMRGFVNSMTPEEFQNWLDEEASYLEE